MITKIDKNAIWICDLTYTQQTIAADLMPAAVAGFATYFKKKKKNVDIKIYKYPEKLVKDLNEKTLPIIVAFSNYVWNKNLLIEFAKEIKKYLSLLNPLSIRDFSPNIFLTKK
jgi:predicted transcriptional regulator